MMMELSQKSTDGGDETPADYPRHHHCGLHLPWRVKGQASVRGKEAAGGCTVGYTSQSKLPAGSGMLVAPHPRPSHVSFLHLNSHLLAFFSVCYCLKFVVAKEKNMGRGEMGETGDF